MDNCLCLRKPDNRATSGSANYVHIWNLGSLREGKGTKIPNICKIAFLPVYLVFTEIES